MGLFGNKVECLCRISKIRKSTANIGTCSSGRNDLFTSGRIEEWKIIVAAAASAPPSSPPKSKKGVALWLARYAHNRKGVYHGVEVAKKVVCELISAGRNPRLFWFVQRLCNGWNLRTLQLTEKNGGDDETRTRDLCRDSPAF